jgi:L-threonylcarbamoyladenylate synthase
VRARILPGDDPAAIAEAAELIRVGEPVAFPTETVYGLGANALDPLAVARVFEAKDRPSFDPLIVHVTSAVDAASYVEPADLDDPRVARLADRFWPGPLTLVLRKRDVIPGIVTAGLDTVGLRVPDHPVALGLLRASGVPIAAPSANRFGGLSPTRAEHVARQLGERIDLILDGGPSRVGIESTVLSLSEGRPRLLRPGGTPLEEIEEVIGPVAVVRDAIDDATDGSRAAASPGSSAAHYAPSVPLELLAEGNVVDASPGERIGLLAASDTARDRALAAGWRFAAIEVPAPRGDTLTLAAGLFEALHRLDAAGLDRIVAQPVPEEGLGRAIMDRLQRAAAASAPGSRAARARDRQLRR